jgi:glutamate/tyrosine decarboxylase-like PLP-dependent enzyme
MGHPTIGGTSISSHTNSADPPAEADFLLQAYTRLRQAITTNNAASPDGNSVLPSHKAIAACLSALPSPGSPSYLSPLGPSSTLTHLLDTVLPALNHQSLSPRYLGFVTGGVLPIAETADNLVSALDQNVQVHMIPSSTSSPWTHSASTAIEDSALRMLISLLELDTAPVESDDDPSNAWPGRTFTTGATASNILGLACGREAVLAARLPAAEGSTPITASVAEVGLLAACQAAGVREIRVLSSMAHSSLLKAASILGLGHRSVKDVGLSGEGEPWRLDLDAVEKELKRGAEDGVAHVIVVSAGEVNTGRFATSLLDMPKLRSLADRYGAWIHVDGGKFCLLFPYRRIPRV